GGFHSTPDAVAVNNGGSGIGVEVAIWPGAFPSGLYSVDVVNKTGEGVAATISYAQRIGSGQVQLQQNDFTLGPGNLHFQDELDAPFNVGGAPAKSTTISKKPAGPPKPVAPTVKPNVPTLGAAR